MQDALETAPLFLRRQPAREGGVATMFRTDFSARLDRLPWSRFHWLATAALTAALVAGCSTTRQSFSPSGQPQSNC